MTKKTILEYKGVDFEVQYNYQPEEKQTLEHEGCCEEITIEDIKHNGTCFYELLESDFDNIIDLIYDGA